jgi:hypothetical protein
MAFQARHEERRTGPGGRAGRGALSFVVTGQMVAGRGENRLMTPRGLDLGVGPKPALTVGKVKGWFSGSVVRVYYRAFRKQIIRSTSSKPKDL